MNFSKSINQCFIDYEVRISHLKFLGIYNAGLILGSLYFDFSKIEKEPLIHYAMHYEHLNIYVVNIVVNTLQDV